MTFRYPSTDRMWRATTGLSEQNFLRLVVLFERAYTSHYGRSQAERVADSLEDVRLDTGKSLLMFTLVSLKLGTTYDALGYLFDLSHSNAKRNQARGIEILSRALADAAVLPMREFESVEAFHAHFVEHQTILLDATEQRIQRPGDKEVQKEFYSGKKKVTPSNP